MHEDFGLEGWLKNDEKRWTTESWEVGGWAVGKPGSGFVYFFWFFDPSNMDGWLPNKIPVIFWTVHFWQGASKELWSGDKKKWFLGCNGMWDRFWDFLQFSVNSPSFPLRKKETFITSLTCFQPSLQHPRYLALDFRCCDNKKVGCITFDCEISHLDPHATCLQKKVPVTIYS